MNKKILEISFNGIYPVIKKIEKNKVIKQKIKIMQVDDKKHMLSDRIIIKPNKHPISFEYNHNDKLVCTEIKELTNDIKDFFLLKDECSFGLWENGYIDYILPGESWELDLESGAMSKKLNIIKKEVLKNVEVDMKKMFDEKYIKEKILSQIEKDRVLNFCFTVNGQISETLSIFYLKNILPLWSIFIGQYIDKYDELQIIIDNKQDIKNIDNLNIITCNLNEISLNEMCINREEYKFSLNYMLFSKATPELIYFFQNENSCKSMMGYLKYSDFQMFTPCGVSIWEDYYFNPIFHDVVKLENGNIYFSKIYDEDVKNTNNKVKNLLK